MKKTNNLRQAIDYLKYTKVISYDADVARRMGMAPAALSRAIKAGSRDTLARFNETYGNIFNSDWLSGESTEMLAQASGKPYVTRPGRDDDGACASCGEQTSVPLIPAGLAQASNEDVWAYINENTVPRTPVVRQFTKYDVAYQIHSDAMAPRIKAGDYVALRYIGVHPKIFNGEVYCIDTKDTGFIVREVTNTAQGYKLHARSERYEDDNIHYDDVVGVYEVVGAIITNI